MIFCSLRNRNTNHSTSSKKTVKRPWHKGKSCGNIVTTMKEQIASADTLVDLRKFLWRGKVWRQLKKLSIRNKKEALI